MESLAFLSYGVYLFWFLIVLGVAIFFHELGHFLAAKSVGVRVVRFSLGFGPKLLSTTRGDTEYCISAFPLGGYVKMAGDNPEEGLEGKPDEFLSVSPWARIWIVFAGPAMNVVTAVVCYFLVGTLAGQQQLPYRTIHRVVPGSPAAEAGLRAGDTIVAVSGQEVQTYREIRQMLQRQHAGPAPEPVPVTVERTAGPAGEAQRIETTVALPPAVPPRLFPVYDFPALVQEVTPQSPAARAGLTAGAEITEVSGVPVRHYYDVIRVVGDSLVKTATGGLTPQPLAVTWRTPAGDATRAVVLPELQPYSDIPGATMPVGRIGVKFAVGLIRQMYLAPLRLTLDDVGLALRWPPVVGKVSWFSPAAQLGLARGDRIVSVDGTLIESMAQLVDLMWDKVHKNEHDRLVGDEVRVTWVDADGQLQSGTVRVDSDQIPARLSKGDYTKRGSLGIRPLTDRVQLGVLGGMEYALAQTRGAYDQFVFVMKKMISREVSPKHLAGPIGILQLSGEMGKQGWDRLVEFIGLICVNLALINLLPIPVLDGGHILLYTIEGIRRKPWTPRQLEIATWIGLVPILLLFVFIFYNDFHRFFTGLLM